MRLSQAGSLLADVSSTFLNGASPAGTAYQVVGNREVQAGATDRQGRDSRGMWMLEFIIQLTDTAGWPCQNDDQSDRPKHRCVAGVGALGGKIGNWWAWGGASSRSPYLMPESMKSVPRASPTHRVMFVLRWCA